jgi:hypothetical protein
LYLPNGGDVPGGGVTGGGGVGGWVGGGGVANGKRTEYIYQILVTNKKL